MDMLTDKTVNVIRQTSNTERFVCALNAKTSKGPQGVECDRC